MEMQFKNEIKKLADVVVWADNLITAAGFNEERYKSDALTAYVNVKAHELWKIKTVVLEAMNRHTTYTNALNQDIAQRDGEIGRLKTKVDDLERAIKKQHQDDITEYNRVKRREMELQNTVTGKNQKIRRLEEKIEEYGNYINNLNKDIVDKNSKIELLEKELEGRKEGYMALKELMDTKYISIDEHNKIVKKQEDTIEDYEDEIRSLNKSIAKVESLEKELADCKVKIRHQKENLDGINKTLEIRTKENETLCETIKSKRREIEGHESENARLTERIIELKGTITKLYKELEETRACKKLDLAGHQYRETALVNALADNDETIKKLKEENEELKSKNMDDFKRRNNDVINQAACIRELKEEEKHLHDWNNALSSEIAKLREENEDLKTRDEELTKQVANKLYDIDCLRNYVDELKNKNSNLNDTLGSYDNSLKNLKIEYDRLGGRYANVMKDNDKLRLDNSQLTDENSYLKKECKNKNDIIRKAYVRYVDEACKGREEIMNECYEKLTKDDTGYQGFKQYTLRALEAQEGNETKAKEFLCDAADIIFYNKKAEEKRKEEAKKELNEAFGVPKYRPSEIDKLTDFLQAEVDKKRIVDVSKGVEDDIHVTRELLDAAIKLLVAKGYHEYYGGIPQATDATKYDLVHVLTISSVGIKDIVNLENIKSLDFGIPCGSDSIE